jgi:hypothetical protein
MGYWSFIGIIALILVGINFISQLGRGIPIIELMILIAGLQWILGPIIEYSAPTLHYRYYMYVPQETYMSYVVPAYIVFLGVILLHRRRFQNIKLPIENLKQYKDYGLIIFLIGVAFDVLGNNLPGALGFFVFIIANFKFAGALILYFSENKNLKKVFYGALIYLFISALAKAMFHDLILWSIFFYMFWAIKFKPSIKTILLTFLIAAFSLTTLQTIKAAYRSQIWNGYGGNKLELFVSLAIDAVLLNGVYAEEMSDDSNNVRLNQGWIISAIMDEIPDRQEYLGGETITEAISAALIPRFLNTNKKQAGGRENFIKFTGLPIGEGTSMGISIVGEAYGNYKVLGGIIFMGIWGLFLVRVWIFLLKKTQRNLLLLAFLPIIFLQVVKAETELVVVLNHLVKSMIVVFLFFWATKQFLNWQLDRSYEN